MRLAFHAVPPPGEWLNDPNALYFDGGAYRLLAQHRADTPDFRETGWARLSSDDLVRWRWDGVAIPPDGAAWSYSGSVVAEHGRLEATHTLHEDGLECQVLRESGDGGASWTPSLALPSLGPPAHNRRDPFVFRFGDGWRLLLAEPCDWHDWRAEPPSSVRLYASSDRRDWREVGRIDLGAPPGLMWEVPLLVPIDGHWALIVSVIDRRNDGADCGVRAWIGAFDGARFTPAKGVPADGQHLDLGPDFYALMTRVEEGWPLDGVTCVGWLSSWATARAMPWSGFLGGPISLPRALAIEPIEGCPRLKMRPVSGLAVRIRRAVAGDTAAGVGEVEISYGRTVVEIRTPEAVARAVLDGRDLTITRIGADRFTWSRRHANALVAGTRRIELFVDHQAVEMFEIRSGVAVSMAVPGLHDRGAVSVHHEGVPQDIEWG